MTENIDYIYIEKADINEGLSTGTVTKGSIFFTKNYVFIIPFDSLNVFGGEGVDSMYIEIKKQVNEIFARIQYTATEDFENEMKTILGDDRVFEIATLDKFDIKVGFGPFGGMAIKKKGKERKAINIQPKKKREDISNFYKKS